MRKDGSRPKTQTVLIVEDDREIRDELKWALRADYRVKDASDRASALAALRRDAPVVVVLDLGLPPQRRVASEGRRTLGDLIRLKPGMKVIVVTGTS